MGAASDNQVDSSAEVCQAAEHDEVGDECSRE